MIFLVRGARSDDSGNLINLARQFSLLNLPAERKAIESKLEKSEASFRGDIPKSDSSYIFVIENLENKMICGSAQVVAKHGTADEPSYSFQILKRERFSRDLGVGFIHQILRLKVSEDGPTEIGGLVVDRNYRTRPEKIGKLISLARFMYIGMCPERFEPQVYAQMAPPLTDDGRSEFWEALGRRFTGMPYQEADLLSQKNKEFIRSLFPEEDIYLCLLDAKARLVMGRVGVDTQPALHLLESIGFKFINEVDPFDGGPHLGAKVQDVTLVKNGKYYSVSHREPRQFNEQQGLISIMRGTEFLAGGTAYSIEGDEIVLPEKTMRAMELSAGERVFISPLAAAIKGKKHGK